MIQWQKVQPLGEKGGAMRNLRKPTRVQKKKIADAGLNWRNWLVVSESEEELIIYNKKSERRRTVKK